jgi:vacuolar-type H+-ATPase subunit I/STV1
MSIIEQPLFFYLGLTFLLISVFTTVNLDRKCFERIQYCEIKGLEHRLDEAWIQANTYRDISKVVSYLSFFAVLYGFFG